MLYTFTIICLLFLWCRGHSELPSPVVRDDEVTVAARRRRKKVACILQCYTLNPISWSLDILFENNSFLRLFIIFTFTFYILMTQIIKEYMSLLHYQSSSELSVLLFSWLLVSVPSPGSSPVMSSVTPARSLMRNTPASLYRQAGTTHTNPDSDTDPSHQLIITSTLISKRSIFY